MLLSNEIPALCDEIQRLHFEDVACQNSLEGWQAKIAKIKRFNDVDKYKIVFMGRPGSGKTTAICNWLNLLHIEEGEDPKKSYDLLTTGSGNTTVAEVHIRQIQDAPSCIRLDYLSLEAQRLYIEDYTDYYYNFCMENPGNDASSSVQRHTEIDRLIRNMAGLEVIPPKGDKNWDLVTSKIKAFASMDAFQKFILGKIGLEQRNCRNIPFQQNGNFSDWLHKTFDDINFGKNPSCSIPKRIYLDINVGDLNMHLPSFVEEIVDTLGLDSEASARLDLQEFMKCENSLCILVDEINEPPSPNLRNIIKNSFKAGAEYFKEKVAIYIRLKEGDLVNVAGANGDSGLGLRLKQDGLNATIKAHNIPYKCENTLFKDSKEAYLINALTKVEHGKKVTESILSSYSREIADKARKEINDWLKRIIDELKNVLLNDSRIVKKEVENLLELQKQSEKAQTENFLRDVKRKISDQKDAWRREFCEAAPAIEKMLDFLEKTHWATIRAMNRRCGGYETYRIDIYTEFMQAGKNAFAQKMVKLNAKLKNLFVSDKRVIQMIMNGYHQRLDFESGRAIEHFGEKLLNWLLNESAMYPREMANDFWGQITQIYGNGYRNEVIRQYRENLNEQEILDLFAREFEEILNHVYSWLVS